MSGARRERYRLLRTVASGGMARVYEAVVSGDSGFERRVAIKRILPELVHDASLRRMFLDEARIASRLSHANIVQVLDYGLLDGNEMIVFEYVDGIDAGRAAQRGVEADDPMPPSVALHVVAEVAHALAHAHSLHDAMGAPSPVVHRDVSPQNVLLSWEGDVKLADFGIALAEAREEQTATGIVKGKLRYMPPEQAMGLRVGPSADVYALGSTLHALLGRWLQQTGASSPQVAFAHEIGALLDRCCAEHPDARPSAIDLAEELERLARTGMTRSTRATLRDWLAPLRPPRVKPSALDDVMGLCLVPIEGDPHNFTVSRSDASAHRPSDAATSIRTPNDAATFAHSRSDAPTVERPPSDAASSSQLRLAGSAPSRGWAVPLIAVAALLVVVALGAGAVALATRSGLSAAGTPTTPSTRRATTPRATQPVVEPPLATISAPAISPAVPTAPAPTSVPSVVAPPLQRPRAEAEPEPRRHASREQAPRVEERPVPNAFAVRPATSTTIAPTASASSSTSSTTAGSTSAASTTGWLRVGGATLAGGRVEIDGRRAGHAPIERELSIGSHHVVVRGIDDDGVLLDQTIRIGEQHRRASPARILR